MSAPMSGTSRDENARWQWVELPHGEEMRWVRDAALVGDGREAIARAKIEPGNPFVVDGVLLRAGVIELMAQGAAAGAALRASQRGQRIARGVLVAIRELQISGDVPAGVDVMVGSVQGVTLGALTQGLIEVRVGERMVARGDMTFHLRFE
jgi:predicted hotdog family 3-hydroxylacyl-ACP dehydratase